jgi:hypothetical protein
MTRASRRLTSVTAALAVGLFAAAPAAANVTLLKLDKPTNELAVTKAAQAVTVLDYFWAPKGPPPFFVDMHGYLVMPGDDWDAGSPVDDGLLGALVRPGSCQAGARYQSAQLMIADRIHRMRDVRVNGCRPTRDGKAEMMTIAFTTVD